MFPSEQNDYAKTATCCRNEDEVDAWSRRNSQKKFAQKTNCTWAARLREIAKLINWQSLKINFSLVDLMEMKIFKLI